ncbi:LOW QUALITY PROTEIN: etoposide-induced protein 2.4 homolog [Liolophura sinensis]|uniref:LOW QUALITY PROTEIN: etoposide-induced protein 2.4 homolog n=1 Tax=Liolophura sinensis TaxID=3198878 RepID=UPI003158CB04
MTDTVRLVTAGMMRGFRDSILGTLKVYKMDQEPDSSMTKKPVEPQTVLAQRRAERMKHKDSRKESEPKVTHRIMQCCAWNGGVCWLSIILFNNLLLPCLQWFTESLFGGSGSHSVVWSWIGPILSWTFSALWILPLFVLSKIVNSFWFQDIADAAYRKSRGRPQLPSISKVIADLLFSVLLQSLFLIQGMLASFLPIHGIGQLVSLLHMCLLYSLYAFEYKWFNMGWEVHRRLTYIECNWPYFVGFGLPLALLTALPPSLVISGCVFSILFPLFIISANEAPPIVDNIDFPLRLFSPVVGMSNTIFHKSVAKGTSAPSSGGPGTPSSARQVRVSSEPG